MFLIFKGEEYFGVCYENIYVAQYVCGIFEKTLGCEFNIKYYPGFKSESSAI